MIAPTAAINEQILLSERALSIALPRANNIVLTAMLINHDIAAIKRTDHRNGCKLV